MSRSVVFDETEAAAIRREYASGVALARIASARGVSVGPVMKLLRSTRGWTHRGYPMKASCFPVVDGSRQCRTCGQVKPVDSFPKHGSSRLGVLAHCSDCTKVARSDYASRRYLETRRAVLEGYGGKCAACGHADIRALHVDHVNDNGASERKQKCAWSLLRKIIAKSFPPEYQLLCANCNTVKAHEAGLFSRRSRRAV